MNEGAYNGINILKNDTIKLMFTPQYPNDQFIGYGQDGRFFQIVMTLKSIFE